jgi:hypothetical protein
VAAWSRLRRGIAGGLIAGPAIGLAGCHGERIQGPRESESPAFIVSNPVAGSQAAARGAAPSSAGTLVEDVTYVSLAPGTVLYGVAAVITNRSRATTRAAFLSAGGFDPVGVPAAAGDTLELEVHGLDGGTLLHATAVVPAARPPIIVRTDPPPRRRDVPLNASMVIVFSEPMDPLTITTGNVRLTAGGPPVSATVELSADGLRAVLAPEDRLAAGTEYVLEIGTSVTDLDGDALEAVVHVSFVTESPPDAGAAPRILVDASRDGGVWWFPQWEQSGGFDPSLYHQGQALADYLRARGFVVDELPRPFLITTALLQRYDIVIRAGVYGGYTPDEIAAYRAYVQGGGKLLLLADHMMQFVGPADSIGISFGLRFAGITRGDNILETTPGHPITEGVGALSYRVGSGLLSYPDSAQILGTLSAGSYLDLNNNGSQDTGEPSAPAVLGAMTYGAGRIVFSGDTNFWEWIPEPLLSNILAWFAGS